MTEFKLISTLDYTIFVISLVLFLVVLQLSARYKIKQAQQLRIRMIATSTRVNTNLKSLQDMSNTKSLAQKSFYQSTMNALINTLIKFTEDQSNDVRSLFEAAGWSPVHSTIVYAVIKTFLAILTSFVAYLMIISIDYFIIKSFLIKILLIIVSLLFGLQLFNIILKLNIHYRYIIIKRDLSKALDLLAVCTMSGLGIDRSLEYVAEELMESNVELSKELLLTNIELNILPERSVAFRNLAKRVDVPMMRAIVTTLIQSEEQGTSISSTLKILAIEAREQKMSELELRAAKLPAILSLPVILFTLPSLLIMILGPVMINMFHETKL